MQIQTVPQYPVPVRPYVVGGRHAAPVPLTRPLRRIVTAAAPVLVFVVGLAATLVALWLPHSATTHIDAALGRLHDSPSITVDGTLTGDAGPVTVHATITADGAARGTVERSGNARAEFAVGSGTTLLRGNRGWWNDEPIALANRLTDRWITDPHDGSVDWIASGRLAPTAMTDALAVLRDPDGRSRTEVVVDGVEGTAFVRDGVRIVISDDDRPLAVDLPHPTDTDAPSQTATDAPGVAVVISTPDPAEEDAARRAVTDVPAQLGARGVGSLPSRDDLEQPASMNPPVGIDVAPEPGCRRSDCTIRVDLTNRGSAPTAGLFVLQVDDRTVTSRAMTVAPLTRTTLRIELPASVLAATDGSRFRTKASFELLPGASGGSGELPGGSPRSRPAIPGPTI
jgi:hypothetical protein